MLPKDPRKGKASERIAEGVWNHQKVRYRTDRIIVKLKPALAATRMSLQNQCDVVKNMLPEGNIVRPPGSSGRVVFSLKAGTDILELSRRLSDHEFIEYAEPDVVDSSA